MTPEANGENGQFAESVVAALADLRREVSESEEALRLSISSTNYADASTLQDMHRLAVALVRHGNEESLLEAGSLLAQAYNGQELTLGAGHPSTRCSLMNLERLLHSLDGRDRILSMSSVCSEATSECPSVPLEYAPHFEQEPKSRFQHTTDGPNDSMQNYGTACGILVSGERCRGDPENLAQHVLPSRSPGPMCPGLAFERAVRDRSNDFPTTDQSDIANGEHSVRRRIPTYSQRGLPATGANTGSRFEDLQMLSSPVKGGMCCGCIVSDDCDSVHEGDWVVRMPSLSLPGLPDTLRYTGSTRSGRSLSSRSMSDEEFCDGTGMSELQFGVSDDNHSLGARTTTQAPSHLTEVPTMLREPFHSKRLPPRL